MCNLKYILEKSIKLQNKDLNAEKKILLLFTFRKKNSSGILVSKNPIFSVVNGIRIFILKNHIYKQT